jgi:diadenylate cyclase
MPWLIENINLTDVLDILLLSYIIYRALMILKGTRAVQSLVGLGFLLLLYAVSQEFHLHSIHWLLDKFFVYLVLAIIILFQEDIRRGLARAGSLFPNLQRAQGSHQVVSELIKVSFALGARRIGALIAIEQNASLMEYAEPAIQLDAKVSTELLTAIFIPTSPLHDGAVIIQDNRISAAQAFLPLSKSKTLSKRYGTRHCAAIGLTELTDSIVIVISEERGTVGVAVQGNIEVARDSNEMRQILQAAFERIAEDVKGDT